MSGSGSTEGAGSSAEERPQRIGTRTLRGIFWVYGSFVGGQTLVLITTAILARLLSPDDFGLAAVCVTFIVLLDTLSDLGITQALVITGEDKELEHAETVFVWTIGFGALLTAVTAAAAPAAAAFFNQPEVVALLPVLGLRFFLRSLGATHYALAQRRMVFRSRTVAELVDVGTRGLTGVVLAVAGLGVWSLVLGYVAGSLAFSIALWLTVPWRPRLRPRRAHLPEMLRFGGTLTVVDALAAVYSNLDYIFIGRVLGATQLGLYTVAFRLPDLLIGNLASVVGLALFPAFAAIERSDLGRVFCVSLRYTLMVALPMAALLSVLAEPLILAVFGDRWAPAVPAMQVLTLYALAIAFGIPAGTAYKASGRAGVLLAIGAPRLCLLVVSVAVFVDQGIVAVAACVGIVTMVFALIGLGIATRMLRVRIRALLATVWAPVAAATGMAVVLLAVREAIASPWPALVAGMLLGGLTYLALLRLLARDSLRRLWAIAFPETAIPSRL